MNCYKKISLHTLLYIHLGLGLANPNPNPNPQKISKTKIKCFYERGDFVLGGYFPRGNLSWGI